MHTADIWTHTRAHRHVSTWTHSAAAATAAAFLCCRHCVCKWGCPFPWEAPFHVSPGSGCPLPEAEVGPPVFWAALRVLWALGPHAGLARPLAGGLLSDQGCLYLLNGLLHRGVCSDMGRAWDGCRLGCFPWKTAHILNRGARAFPCGSCLLLLGPLRSCWCHPPWLSPSCPPPGPLLL